MSVDEYETTKPGSKPLRDQLAACQAERDEAKFNLYLSNNAHGAVRRLLDENGVPSAAFIDDNVGNAIWQRNQATQRGNTYRARALALLRQVERQRSGDKFDKSLQQWMDMTRHHIVAKEAAEHERDELRALLERLKPYAEYVNDMSCTDGIEYVSVIEIDAALARPQQAAGGDGAGVETSE